MSVLAGRYEVIRTLGRGGMGEVVLARQLNLGRLVVIKRVLAEDDPRQVSMLLEEAKLAARLSHPAIVGVLDVSAVPPFIAMEYVPGLTVREMVPATGGIALDVALTIAIDVLRGLVYAHRAGVLHRDIKPRNIMVTFNGFAKLIDFGISRWVSTDGVWESTSLAGTPGYMAPELQPGARIDGRVDQFALGVTLRELLVGQEAKLAAPDSVEPIPAPLRAIIDCATALARDDRYPSCVEMLAAVEQAAKALGVSPSQAVVEQYLRDHHADRIESWQRDSANALAEFAPNPSEAMTRPLTAPHATEGISNGAKAGYAETEQASDLDRHAKMMRVSTPPVDANVRSAPQVDAYAGPQPSAPGAAPSDQPSAPTSSSQAPQPRRRSLRPWLFAGVTVIAIAGVAVGLAARRSPKATVPTVVGISVENAASADDAWLAPAIEHVVVRDLRDARDRRFGLTSTQASVTTPIVIAYKPTPRGVMLEARRRGEAAVLASAEGASVVAASAALVPALIARTNRTGARLVPDADEAEQMTKLGARSYEQFVRLRAVSERLRMSGYHDPAFAVGELRALLKEDPTWARLHAELSQTLVKRGEEMATIAEGLRVGDRTRDPNGMNLLEGYKAIDEGRWVDAERLAGPVFARNDADLIAGEITYQGLWGVDRDEESRAVVRRLYDKYPALYFGGDLVTAFEREVQRDRALELARQITAAHPENISAMREVVRLEADGGDLAGARRDAQRMLLVHGVDSPFANGDLFEALLAVDDLATAHRVVDAMLLGSPLTRARGLYRAAIVAVHEGRFDLARTRSREAVAAFADFGDVHSERPQGFALLRDIEAFDGDRGARADALHGLAESYAEDPAAAAQYRYYEQVVRTGKCPDVDAFVAGLDDTFLISARRWISRIRSDIGCDTCAATLEAGLGNSETSNESVLMFAKCALATGDFHLAKRAAQTATVWSSWNSSADASPLAAILAHYYLAEALAKLGDAPSARTHYERFLQRWGDMPKPIPEVAKAKLALTKLPP